MDSKLCTKCGVLPRTRYAWWCNSCLAEKARIERARKPPKDPEVTKGVTKRCGVCKQVKPVSQFYIKNRKSGLLQSRCAPCVVQYQIRYRRKRMIERGQKVKRVFRGADLIAQTCTVCKCFKPAAAFYAISGINKARTMCGACAVIKNVEWKEKNLERYLRSLRSAGIKRYHGLTVEEYERQKAVFRREQEGRCAICQRDLPPEKECMDHCHTTGILRGLLCTNCNSGIGMLADDTERLAAAIRYLEQSRIKGSQSVPLSNSVSS